MNALLNKLVKSRLPEEINYGKHTCKHCRMQSKRRRRKINLHRSACQSSPLYLATGRVSCRLRLSPVVDPCPARTGYGGRRAQRLLQAAHSAAVQGYGTQNLARRPLHAHRSASEGRPHPARRLPPADCLLRTVLSKGLS